MKLNCRAQNKDGRQSAFTLMEAMVAVFVLGVLGAGLAAAFSSGLSVMDAERDNLRATQIMMQKMETIRLLTWSQGTNSNFAPTNFTDYYDPTGTNNNSSGAVYAGNYSVGPAPTNIPSAYRSNMRLVTVTVYWTNYPAHGRPPIVQSRQMQSCVARYGMQNYVYR